MQNNLIECADAEIFQNEKRFAGFVSRVAVDGNARYSENANTTDVARS